MQYKLKWIKLKIIFATDKGLADKRKTFLDNNNTRICKTKGLR